MTSILPVSRARYDAEIEAFQKDIALMRDEVARLTGVNDAMLENAAKLATRIGDIETFLTPLAQTAREHGGNLTFYIDKD